MIEYKEALEKILKNVCQLQPEKTRIEYSAGRVLKEDIYSGIDMPPFNKSAVDGYAVCAADVKNAPVKLTCIGIIQAGGIFKKKIRNGECIKIMTGAPLPSGADSVIMVENSTRCGSNVLFSMAVKKGENICFKGEDIKGGQKVLAQGKKISLSDVALLATVGSRYVKTIGKPRVAVLNTGGEIIEPGTGLSKNKIYNSNGPMLQALLKSDGIEPFYLGIARDTCAQLQTALEKGLRSDILLISGGVSMGDYDLVPQVLKKLGIKRIFHKVNIKPGKPLFFGRKKKTLVFGIPGNPVSNFLSYLIFIRPALYKMAGRFDPVAGFKQGWVEREFHVKAGRRHFVMANMEKRGGRYYLYPVSCHGSADVAALSRSNAFITAENNQPIVKKGSKIGFIAWENL